MDDIKFAMSVEKVCTLSHSVILSLLETFKCAPYKCKKKEARYKTWCVARQFLNLGGNNG